MSEEELLKTRVEVIKYLSDGYMLNVIVDVINDTIELLQEYKQLEEENKQLKDNWNKLKEELKEKFEEYRYVEDECLRTMAQEDDSILFSMSCIEKGDSNE